MPSRALLTLALAAALAGCASDFLPGSVLDAGSGTYVPTYGATNTARLPAFWQLDLRVDRTWTYRTWKLSAFLDVQNATNRGNVEGYSYNYDYSRRSDYGWIFLPSLGVRVEF